jgi:hypothetical protein
MSTATIFCFTCKRHVVVHGATIKDRWVDFHAFGHSAEKVAQLRRGPVGTPPKVAA